MARKVVNVSTVYVDQKGQLMDQVKNRILSDLFWDTAFTASPLCERELRGNGERYDRREK
jgi:hypothetical protein